MIDILDEIASVFEELEDHVGITLGPDGKNILIEENKKVFVTKDGVTVVKNFKYPEEQKHKNMIVRILSDMSRRTDAVVGDGTTSTVVFAYRLFSELYKYKKAGFMANDLIKGAKIAIQEASRNLAKFSSPVNTPEEIERIAYISSNGDKTISEILANAFEYLGKDGAIVVNESNAPKPFAMKIKNGFSIKAGFPTRHFITNHTKKTCELNDVYLLTTDYGLMHIEPLMNVLKEVAEQHASLLIVCDFVEGDALQALIENNVKGNMSVVVIQAPHFDKEKKNFFEDLSVFAGGRVVSKTLKDDLYSVGIADLGKLDHIEVGMKSSLLVGGHGNKEEVKKHVDFLKEELNEASDEEEIELINKRILRFGSGVAEIMIGGDTEAEVVEKRYRLDDALMAMNSALTSGYCAGGGTTYVRLAGILEKHKKTLKLNDGEAFGYGAVISSMFSILNRLLKNSEIEVETHKISRETIKEKLVKKCREGIGFDFRAKKFKKIINTDSSNDLIIEPSMIIENVLGNSLSIVTLLLKTERILWSK